MTKQPNDTRGSLIRNTLIICLLLLSALSPSVRANASAADSVYFCMQLDTLGGIRAKQVLKLTYALVNAQFDSVAAPVFGDSIEVVSGPKPHKMSSYGSVNGVESKKHETGFYYFIRFKVSGEIPLPAASVKVGHQTLTTPGRCVSVRRAEVDRSKLQCRLEVEKLTGSYAKYRAKLICNVRPDQYRPLLIINGKTTQPSSTSYSNADGHEKYVYSYYFSSDGYEVASKELTFGGIPYFIEPKKSKPEELNLFFFVTVAACGLFELTWWLAFRHRYREEKDAPLAAFVLKNKTLPLIISWANTHYGASHLSLLFAVMFLSITGVTLYIDGLFLSLAFWFAIACVPLAYVLYRMQRSKLKFQNLPTTLNKQAIYDCIYHLSVTYDWDIDHYGDDCIVAHTNPALWHLTWGEQIFIVFDQNQVWLNSVNDLNKRTSICSFGHNKRNIQRIKQALTQGTAIKG